MLGDRPDVNPPAAVPRITGVSTDYLGAGGRLTGGPAPELVRAGYAHEISHAPRLARWLSLADLAHAVALVEGGAVSGDDARGLLDGLLALDAIAPERLPLARRARRRLQLARARAEGPGGRRRPRAG